MYVCICMYVCMYVNETITLAINVGYRMFFHDRARGEAECEIMKKTFYNVGYNMVWLLTYFQIFQNRNFFIFRITGFKFYLTPSLTSMI